MRIAAALLTSFLLVIGCRSADDPISDGEAPADTAAVTPHTPQAGIVPTGDVPGQGLIPGGETHVFECTTSAGDSLYFTVRSDSATTWLWMPHDIQVEPVQLQHIRSASGARYSNEDPDDPVEFWNKGQEATFVVGGTRYTDCVRDNYRSVWERAKLDGVDFRGLGNEPGWIVDIHAGDRFDVQWRYGERTARLPYTEPETPNDSTTVFRSETDDHSMTLTITGGGCMDSMSGIGFPASVTLLIDGSEYTGCGRPLH